MRDLVDHPGSGLTLDFTEDDFGGDEQGALIRAWQDRGHRVESQDEFICHFHRNHDQPWLYLQERDGLLVAAHWPKSGLSGSHEIVHGVSDEHKRQVEYMQRAGQAAGFDVKTEVILPTKVRSDAIIYGPQIHMGVEVQRSGLSAAAAKARTTKARRAGVLPVWFSDSHGTPIWLGKVPGVRMNPDTSWGALPQHRSVTVVSGVRRIVPRRCHNMQNSQCPEHRYGCRQWHPDHDPRPTLVDDLAERFPLGDLVPVQFQTPSGRDLVLIVSKNDKARYETMTGRSADLPLREREKERTRPPERIECSADAGPALVAVPAPPVVVPKWAQPSPPVAIGSPKPLRLILSPAGTYEETLAELTRVSIEHRRAKSAGLRRYWKQQIDQRAADLQALKRGS